MNPCDQPQLRLPESARPDLERDPYLVMNRGNTDLVLALVQRYLEQHQPVTVMVHG